jgi:Holliday junction resolvase RusA-like endonuclease
MTKAGHAYNPDTAKEWKGAVQAYFMMHRKPQINEPVSLSVSFFLPRPKRMKGDDNIPLPHAMKPDTDNLLKAVMDAMTDAGVWKDDAQSFAISADKWYASAESRVGAQIVVRVLS